MGWWTNHAHIRFVDSTGIERTEQVPCDWLTKYRIPPEPSAAEMAAWAVACGCSRGKTKQLRWEMARVRAELKRKRTRDVELTA